ncbi:MAG: DUF4397 domain-containing protein [Deltaproteobacteria bacterium]|nr:DUF4397 domain-containing protein [Deltaproteobacteria bacterium]
MVSARRMLLAAGLMVGSFTWGCGGGDPPADSPSAYTTGTTTGGTTSATTAGGGSTGLSTSGSSGTTAGTTGTTGTRSVGFVRIANLSPNLPPFDFCVGIPGGTNFTGPIIHQVTGTTNLLAFGTVTNYFPVPEGTFEIRVVAGSGTSCADAKGNLKFSRTATVKAGEYATLALEGFTTGVPLVSLQMYGDDTATPIGMSALRFIHAAPDFPSSTNTTVDVGLGPSTSVKPIFNNVRFTQIALPDSVIDGNGYAVTSPLNDATLTLRPADSTTNRLTVSGLRLSPNELYTAFAVIQPPNGIAFLLCIDGKQLASPTTPKAGCKIER